MPDLMCSLLCCKCRAAIVHFKIMTSGTFAPEKKEAAICVCGARNTIELRDITRDGYTIKIALNRQHA